MSVYKGKLRILNETTVMFWCPGCGGPHTLKVHADTRPCWGYNDDPHKPTFTPSVLSTTGNPEDRCHSFITDGHIKFLMDCGHGLKGQTVPLPEYPEHG